MITNLSVQGFKSFGACVSTRLQPLNFVVGANASGKTNLISALRFVQCAISSNVEQALGEFGGKAEVWNKLQHERREAKHLEIGFTVDSLGEFEAADEARLSVLGATYTLKVKFLSDNGRAAIVGEHLTAQLKSDAGEVKRFHFHRNRTRLAILDESDPRFAREVSMEVPPQEISRPVAGGVLYARPVLLLREFVQSWAFFDFDANVGREPSREADSPLLGRRGENLATVLHEIEEHGEGNEFRAIVDGLRGVVPGFHRLSTVALPFEAKRGFQIKEEKLQSPLNPQSASDGTIRILLLLVAAVWSAKRAGLICIEEPENGLHPFLAEHLVKVLRRASVGRQFLVTTHNPFFLDHLAPEELLLCDKESGFTTLRHAADVEEIQGFQKHFSLGELWTQGELGGVP
ncbi:MAG: AAA family ATPase [Chthoniobacteraceae bacterium]